MLDHDDDNDDCSADKCYMMNRSERNRSLGNADQNTEMPRLFFVHGQSDGDKSEPNEEIFPDISCQEIMDSIHNYIYHTIRIGPKEIEQKTIELQQNEAKGKQEDDDLYDVHTHAVTNLIEHKQTLSRYRRNSNRYSSGNKFITTNEPSKTTQVEDDAKSIAVYQSAVYGNDQLLLSSKEPQKMYGDQNAVLMMDALLEELTEKLLERNAVSDDSKGMSGDDLLNTFRHYVKDQDFDTDSVAIDFENKKESNIMTELKSSSKSSSVAINLIFNTCYKFAYRSRMHGQIYSEGIRFFYWSYYQNMNEKENVLYKDRTGNDFCESNPGYKIKDWYIKAAWKDLKDEALNNSICPFSIYEYKLTAKKAAIKLNQWESDDAVRQLINKYYSGFTF